MSFDFLINLYHFNFLWGYHKVTDSLDQDYQRRPKIEIIYNQFICHGSKYKHCVSCKIFSPSWNPMLIK